MKVVVTGISGSGRMIYLDRSQVFSKLFLIEELLKP